MDKLGLIGLLALALFSSCADPMPPETARSPKSRIKQSSASVNEVNTLVADNTEFAVSLYQQLAQSDGNLIFSPYSISLTIAMIYVGARGETGEEIAKTLNFTLSQGKLPKAFNRLDLALARQGEKGKEEKFCLNLCNALWGQRGYLFDSAFLDTLAMNYGADIKIADFAEAPEDARRKINAWAQRETEGKIAILLPEGSITSITRLVLTEAACFRAEWLLPFTSNDTRMGNFTLLSGETVTVPLMQQTNLFKYAKDENLQAIELPFEMGRFSLLILLPNEEGFGPFEQQLQGKRLEQIIGNLRSAGQIELTLPKFKITSGFMLKSVLSDMGMATAFSPKADFSGIKPDGELFIEEVYQKAFISIDEKGAEASAATGAVLEPGVSLGTVSLRVDRPFIFLIRDLDTGSVIFLGRVVDPRELPGD